MVGTCKPEYDTNLCASWETEREKAYGADKFSMSKLYKNHDRCARPPQALLKARLDTIAVVPARMLPLTKTLQEVLSHLPEGTVFLCHTEENTRQTTLLERVEETFRQQGQTVRSMSVREVYTHTAKSGYSIV